MLTTSLARLTDYVKAAEGKARINLGLARAAATSSLRTIDERNPVSWEFSGLSQNNEDGVIDFLERKLTSTNRYFLEIGAANGVENNTAWLALARRFSGIMVEGDPKLYRILKRIYSRLNLSVGCYNTFIERDSCRGLYEQMRHKDPDVVSLDIDGVDLHIMQTLFEVGLRPKIVVVEYNSAYGPSQNLSVPYQRGFIARKAHATGLYYGASITAWREFFDKRGYAFVGVESSGVNAFFIRPDCFEESFVKSITPICFAENTLQAKRWGGDWQSQFSKISTLPFVEA